MDIIISVVGGRFISVIVDRYYRFVLIGSYLPNSEGGSRFHFLRAIGIGGIS